MKNVVTIRYVGMHGFHYMVIKDFFDFRYFLIIGKVRNEKRSHIEFQVDLIAFLEVDIYKVRITFVRCKTLHKTALVIGVKSDKRVYWYLRVH